MKKKGLTGEHAESTELEKAKKQERERGALATVN